MSDADDTYGAAPPSLVERVKELADTVAQLQLVVERIQGMELWGSYPPRSLPEPELERRQLALAGQVTMSRLTDGTLRDLWRDEFTGRVAIGADVVPMDEPGRHRWVELRPVDLRRVDPRRA